jgi:hypothetical protein
MSPTKQPINTNAGSSEGHPSDTEDQASPTANESSQETPVTQPDIEILNPIITAHMTCAVIFLADDLNHRVTQCAAEVEEQTKGDWLQSALQVALRKSTIEVYMLAAIRGCSKGYRCEVVEEESMRCTKAPVSLFPKPGSVADATMAEYHRPTAGPLPAQNMSTPVFEITAYERRIIQKYRDMNQAPGRLYGKAQQAWAEILLYVRDPEEWLKRKIGEENKAYLDGFSTAMLLAIVACVFYKLCF